MSMGDETCGLDTEECANPDTVLEGSIKDVSDLFLEDLLNDMLFDNRQSIELLDDGEIEVQAY